MIIDLNLFVVLSFFLSSCDKKGCTDEFAINYNEKAEKDDGSCLRYGNLIKIEFQHTFNDMPISFNQLQYENEHGEIMSLSKVIYHLSDFVFYSSTGDSIVTDFYHLIDLSDATSLNFDLPYLIPGGSYTGFGFNFGFDNEDNISGSYQDLNAKNWNWPESLGGGYHQLQIEGKFISNTNDTLNYAFHSGSKIKETDGSETTFHENYIPLRFDFSAIEISETVTIKLNMEISEWFKNPNEWDLNTLNNGLMSIYEAQILIHQNGKDVFELVEIIQ